MDPSEEEYFNTSDDEDENGSLVKDGANGIVTGPPRPLVDYVDDDDDAMEGIKNTNANNASANSTDSVSPETDSTSPEVLQSPPATPKLSHSTTNNVTPTSESVDIPTPERLAEKRRRTEEEDDEDELARLANRDAKRRSPSVSSSTPETVRQGVAVVRNSGKKVGGGLSISVGGIVSSKAL